MGGGQLGQPGAERRVERVGPLDQAIAVDTAHGSADRRHRERVAAERAVRLPALVAQQFGDRLRHDHGGGGRDAPGQALAQGDDVRSGLAPLHRQPPALAAQAGHRLVGDPQGACRPGRAGQLVLVGGRRIDAALAVVDDHGRRVGQRVGQVGWQATAAATGRARGVHRAAGRRQTAHVREARDRAPAIVSRREAAVPLRLHGHLTGQAHRAEVGTLPGYQPGPPGEHLGQAEGQIVGLAAAGAEAHRAGPALLAAEGVLEQVVGGPLATRPEPSLVECRAARRATDHGHQIGMAVPEGRRGVARVDHAPAIGQPEPDAGRSGDLDPAQPEASRQHREVHIHLLPVEMDPLERRATDALRVPAHPRRARRGSRSGPSQRAMRGSRARQALQGSYNDISAAMAGRQPSRPNRVRGERPMSGPRRQ